MTLSTELLPMLFCIDFILPIQLLAKRLKFLPFAPSNVANLIATSSERRMGQTGEEEARADQPRTQPQ